MQKLLDFEQVRVAGNLAPHVLAFVRERVASGETTFHLTELVRYVTAREMCSPNSPARILQLLKESGEVNYEVLSRRKSLYRIVAASPCRL